MIDINAIIDKLQKKIAKDTRFISNSELKHFIEEYALENDLDVLTGLKTHYRNTLRSYRNVLDTFPGMNAARERDEYAASSADIFKWKEFKDTLNLWAIQPEDHKGLYGRPQDDSQMDRRNFRKRGARVLRGRYDAIFSAPGR